MVSSLEHAPYVTRKAFALALLFGLQTLALRLIDSIATVGFVSELGAGRLPWVWLGDLLLSLGAGAAYMRVADRWPRAQLVRRLLSLNAAGYVSCAALHWLGCSPAVCYVVAYVWSAQQVALLPTALWTLTSDVHEASARARAFPGIAAGESIGHLAGYALTAWVGARFASTPALDSSLCC